MLFEIIWLAQQPLDVENLQRIIDTLSWQSDDDDPWWTVVIGVDWVDSP